jgi:hypothetical protein
MTPWLIAALVAALGGITALWFRGAASIARKELQLERHVSRSLNRMVEDRERQLRDAVAAAEQVATTSTEVEKSFHADVTELHDRIDHIVQNSHDGAAAAAVVRSELGHLLRKTRGAAPRGDQGAGALPGGAPGR